jgi:DNA polymerase II small subunit
MGDFHFGSKVFLKDAFEKFISWISREQGSEAQKELAKKVKYLFLVGDLVDGVGEYPGHEYDLEIPDIYAQYSEFAKHLSRIPSGIRIIVCPGNHDAMRIAEPQPTLYKDFAEPVWNLPNVTMVSNPAMVNIHASKEFPGFDVLLYHGFSFIYYADNVESIRNSGGQQRVDMIMKFLLQRRHLAPTHRSNLYLPDPLKDNLVIEKIPDFFTTGHIHRVSATNYRNVTLLSCSCWLEKTEYQEKRGLHPQPGRAILVNLQTRKVKIMNFYTTEGQTEQGGQGEQDDGS